jgi:hypothetical protein
MSGNYQSRVFTFISKRTNRLKDTCAQGFRHIKVAVVWSGQALLYPFHLLAQTTKIFQPQLETPAQKPVLPPVSDINIEQALELVVDAGYPIEITDRPGSLVVTDRSKNLPQRVSTSRNALVVSDDSSNLGFYDPDTDDWEVASYSPRRSQQVVTKKPVIQGLSSLLVDRQLVLITTENEILDILTSSQQQEIRRRIGIDLAVEWYQWSTGEVLDRHSSEQLALDKAAAAQLAIASSEDQPTPNLLDRWQNWLKNLTTKSESAIVPSSDFTTEQIDRSKQTTSNSQRQIAPASYTFNPQPPSINSLPETLRERFLDLPQLPPIHESESLVIQDNSIQQTFTKLQPEWLKQWWNYYREYLSIPTTGFDEFESSQLIHQPEEFQLTRLDQPIDGIERVTSSDRSSEITINQHQPQQHSGKLDRKVFQNVEFDPDWIETAAEQVGYSRSPIIQLLEWIDRLFLQIENWVINIWEKMTNSSNQS